MTEFLSVVIPKHQGFLSIHHGKGFLSDFYEHRRVKIQGEYHRWLLGRILVLTAQNTWPPLGTKMGI